MHSSTRRRTLIAVAIVSGAVLVACAGGAPSTQQTDVLRGATGVKLRPSDPNYVGAAWFAEKCGGCHTLNAAGTEGSATNVSDRERTDGPNFDARKETVKDVLYAIHNGGFSRAIMPQNISTGPEAARIARFVATFSGSKITQSASAGR